MPASASSIKALLLVGMATPLVYFAVLFVAGAFYPDFSHMRQVASELGADGAPYGGAFAFNLCLIIVGLLGIAASIGVYQALRRVGANTLLSAVTALLYAAPMANFILSGLWPLPHPWHSSVISVLTGFFAPLLAAVTLKPMANTRGLKIGLILSFVLILVAFNGLAGLSNPELSGLRWRIIALALMGSLALLSWALFTRLKQSNTPDKQI